MQSITITGSKRESVGKVSTKALRNAGKVPCVLYGGDKPLHFSADEISFKKLVWPKSTFIFFCYSLLKYLLVVRTFDDDCIVGCR